MALTADQIAFNLYGKHLGSLTSDEIRTVHNIVTSQAYQTGTVPPKSISVAPFSSPPTTALTPSQSVDDLIKRVMQQTQQPTPVSPYKFLDISKLDFTVPTIDKLVADAFNDKQLVNYYTKLLQESQGDVDRAITRLEQDYQRGLRYSSEDVARKVGYQKEDLEATLEQLGIKFPQERETLIDTLNKRGIALTEARAPGSPLQVAGGGRAAHEMEMLSEDQRLRKEAVERTASQTIEELGIAGKRDVEEAGLKRTRGREDITREQQVSQEKLQRDREERALQVAQYRQTEQIAGEQMKIQREMLKAQQKAAGLG